MNGAKIRLSPQEAALITNADWILTKNNILLKVKRVLENLQLESEPLLQQHASCLPAEILKPSFKISRGENYLGLPYMVLDYPRYFKGADIFTLRTMFWWGHFFSVTLQLAGTYKTAAEQAVLSAYLLLQEKGYSIAVGTDPWQHHFGQENYRPLAELEPGAFEAILREKEFLKLAITISLQQWDEVPVLALQYADDLLGILTV
jgi:hypothetical protein